MDDDSQVSKVFSEYFFMVFHINIKTSFSSEQSFLKVLFMVFNINIKTSGANVAGPGALSPKSD